MLIIFSLRSLTAFAGFPETVMKKLVKLREIQNKLKIELSDDGYMDYGLIICQANGRPIMTEHLNKRFKEVLAELNDPTINIDNVVFHSLRHTSTSVKLRLSKGDLKAAQGDGGWNTPDMITKRYAHIMDEDRRCLADEMEARFYQGKTDIRLLQKHRICKLSFSFWQQIPNC